MKITAVGPGAIGTLFGVLLAKAGHQVHMLDKDPARAARLAAGEFVLETGQGNISQKLPVTANPAEIGPGELVLICVKAYDTEIAARSIAPLIGPQTIVLTVQNGLGNAEILREAAGKEHILAGSTAQGANVVEPGRVIHAGKGETLIGELDRPATPRVEKLAEQLTAAGIPTAASDDVTGLLWGKLIINAGINPLTALLKVRNGALIQREETRALMAMAVKEAADVAEKKGIKLPFPDPLAKVEDVAGRTAANKSSMLQDVLKAKRTEIDFICGAIVREAQKLSLPAPVNHALTLLVRSLSPA